MTQRRRLWKDKAAGKIMLALTIFSGSIVFLMFWGLYQKAKPILAVKPLRELLFSTSWQPLKGSFGLLPFLMGTLWVTATALLIAVPFSLLTAIYLAEYAPKRVSDLITPLIDLLTGIPSVVYGVWGVLVIVPLIKDYIAPRLGIFSTGYSILAAGIVLAIMILPVIIHVCVEVFKTIPGGIKEASWALGATKWQTVKYVIMRKSLPAVIAAIVLGVSRALGETMAVLMVAGNVARLPSSVLDPAYPLPALLANNYGEMMSVPLYDSALLLAALVLMLVVLFFNITSRLVLIRVERRIQ
ncbi:MAG: phosphate ABC transporter permease subunit PstC [Candidatus Omnitrophota bacterium]